MSLSTRSSRIVLGCFIAIVSVVILPPSGQAADLQVICPGGGPGAFSSISAALSTLNPNDSNTITVSGSCVENIFITNFERLKIQSAFGQTATVTAADPSGIVIQTFQSTGIVLTNLVVQGGSVGILLNQGSNATIFNCTIQGNSGDGLDMQMASTLVMRGGTIQNNQGSGMGVAGGSNATMATQPNERIRILNNGGDGIDVDGSAFGVNFGTLDVENNAGAAIAQTGGRMEINGGKSVNGGNRFEGNGEGIDIFQAGSAQFFGRNVISGNGDVGLQILASSAMFNGHGTLPDGTPNVTVIQNHNIVGVNVVRLGELGMNGPHQIQNNGSSVADPTLRGGIRVNRGSLTLRNGVQITGNIGPGIRADQNSGTSIANVTISSNTEEGVHVDRQSVAGFIQPFSIVGNGLASISCDTTSLVFGDLTGVANINCMRIERENGPPRPGRVQP